jgi:flagellar motor protein MotB
MAGNGRLIRTCTAVLVLVCILAGSMSGCSTEASRQPSSAAAQEKQDRLHLELERYREHLAAGARESAAKDRQIASLQREVDRLQLEVDNLGARNQELLSRRPAIPGQSVGVLMEAARVHGELMTFDEGSLTLVLRSDLAFQRGTESLTREAAAAIAWLAVALNSDHSASLDVRVVVHGDAKPIADPAGAQLRREIWELTNRQALAVGSALAAGGVSSERLAVMGQGASYPRETNLTAQGRSANRRVEIRLFPESGEGSPSPIGPVHTSVDWDVLE